MNELDIKARRLAIYFGLILFAAALFSYLFFSRPSNFPAGRVIAIEKGGGLSDVVAVLRQEKAIRFTTPFKLLVFLTGSQHSIKAGDYFFERSLSIFEIYQRIKKGIYGVEPLRATILEGWSVNQIGEYLEKLGFFPKKEWLDSARDYEGYLFPDTYFFLPDATPGVVVKALRENFEKKVDADLRQAITNQGKNLSEIITMASLIEKEMSSEEDGRIISGILWKRLEAEMGLQVDATLTYIIGKPSLELTEEDLNIESPYNTYKYRGLPPTPIANPGLEAIKAAIFPEKSPYWYYLHDSQGQPHYASDFEEHKANKEKFLR